MAMAPLLASSSIVFSSARVSTRPADVIEMPLAASKLTEPLCEVTFSLMAMLS